MITVIHKNASGYEPVAIVKTDSLQTAVEMPLHDTVLLNGELKRKTTVDDILVVGNKSHKITENGFINGTLKFLSVKEMLAA